jgi:DNA gyrase subunit B
MRTVRPTHSSITKDLKISSEKFQKKQTINPEPFYIEKEDDEMRLESAFLWVEKPESIIHSYANSIKTDDGGTHENGFRNGMVKALRAYIDRRNLLPKGITGIISDDAREGLIAIISIYLQGDVEFQGQTKGRLNSDITSQVEAVVKNSLEQFLYDNQTIGDKIANRVIIAAEARQRVGATKNQYLPSPQPAR